MKQGPYKAQAFVRTPAPRTVSGELSFAAGQARFATAEGVLECSLDELELRVGGHNDEQLFLNSPRFPDWSIYTGDLGVLEDPAWEGQGRLREMVLALRAKRRKSGQGTRLLLGVAGLLIAALLAGMAVLWSRKDALVRWAADQIPIEWEIEFGESLFEQIRSEGSIVEAPEQAALLERITTPLLRAAPDLGYPFKFHVKKDPTVNAFALPGGNVVVHTGLLEAAKRPEEVAGVLAHEIAHVTQRHGFRKLIESAGLVVILRFLAGDSSGLLGMISDSSRFLLTQQFSREYEREADDAGWEYLVEARIDPRGLIDFFETLRGREGAGGSEALSFLNTHPATRERINRLAEKWEKMEGKEAFVPISLSISDRE